MMHGQPNIKICCI